MSASEGGGFVFRIGGWYRFAGMTGNFAYIFTKHDREMSSDNAVWLPMGSTCQIPEGQVASQNAFEVPDEHISDDLWRALGEWSLTGETTR